MPCMLNWTLPPSCSVQICSSAGAFFRHRSIMVNTMHGQYYAYSSRGSSHVYLRTRRLKGSLTRAIPVASSTGVPNLASSGVRRAEAHLFGAGTPGIRRLIAGRHDDVVQWVHVAVWRDRVVRCLDVDTAHKMVRACSSSETALSIPAGAQASGMSELSSRSTDRACQVEYVHAPNASQNSGLQCRQHFSQGCLCCDCG